MAVRHFILLAGLSASLIGCVAYPPPYYTGNYDNQYGNDDYRGTPSYEGYYYTRIIFISSIPYYVDDDRQIRPIPPQYRDHFIRYPYQNLRRPPVFSSDKEVRDGYPMSRIIYLNGVPYNVGDNRSAQPLPNNLRPRFRYAPPGQGNAPRNDNRPPFPNSGDRNNAPPAFDPVRGGNQQPGDGRDRERSDRPPFGGDRQGDPNAQASSSSRGQVAPPPGVESRHNPQEGQHAAPQHGPQQSPQQAPQNADQPPRGNAHASSTHKKNKNIRKLDRKKLPARKPDNKNNSRDDGKDNRHD